jgi:hypothetical protein
MADLLPGPVARPGYRLEFHDEFVAGRFDPGKWLPPYCRNGARAGARPAPPASSTSGDARVQISLRAGG